MDFEALDAAGLYGKVDITDLVILAYVRQLGTGLYGKYSMLYVSVDTEGLMAFCPYADASATISERLDNLGKLGLIEIRKEADSPVLVRFTEEFDKTWTSCNPLADEHRPPPVEGPTPHGTVAAKITEDKDTAARIEYIERFFNAENTLADPASLMEFLDIYTGIILRELESKGREVTPSVSVYDPRAIKEVKAAITIICHAIKSISAVLNEKGQKLNHDHLRDLLIEYVGAVCQYYDTTGIKNITLRTLAAPDAVQAFNQVVADFNPGERPYFFVENIIGLR